MADDNIQTILTGFKQLTANPEIFLSNDDTLQEKIRTNLKGIYDFSKSQEKISIPNALQVLLTKNFDLEQIWQQIELQNDPVLTHSLKEVSEFVTKKHTLLFTNLQKDVNKVNKKNLKKNRKKTRNTRKNANENLDEFEDKIDEQLEKSSDESDNVESENDTNESEGEYKPSRKSIVDDKFFKVDEMEAFLKSEEKKTNKKDSADEEAESASETEKEIDFFKDESDSDEDNLKTAKYKDFFVTRGETQKQSKRKLLEDDSSDDEEKPIKSTVELREERLQKRIDALEQSAISEKPWPLKGEITAENRPQNSLLEEIVDFDMTTRPAPVITENVTHQLEDIILQRIKDKVFDDVIKVSKPVDTPLEYKKKLLLDQEKSKHSLAQIYEKEFLGQQEALDTKEEAQEKEEPELHKEVKTLMDNLFQKLDALSNYHFTPKPAVPELKIISNLPSVTMEEVAPITVSDAALLAPEEVKNKQKGDIIGKSERTKTDKKRERRKKKLKQKLHVNEKVKVKKNPNKKSKNNKSIDVDSKINTKAFKSSKTFFTQLQENVQTQINDRLKKRKENRKNLVDRKIKL